MDYITVSLIIIITSGISGLVTIITINYNEASGISAKDPEIRRKLFKIGTFLILLVQFILILVGYYFISSILICLYAPGLTLAKYDEEKKILNVTKLLFFFGLFFFGISLSYLRVTSIPILDPFIPPDLLNSSIYFAIAGGLYFIFGFGLAYERRTPHTHKWHGNIADFFNVASLLSFSISTLIFLIFDRVWVIKMFDFLIIVLIISIIVMGITELILIKLNQRKYLFKITFAFIHLVILLGYFLLSFIINYKDLFLFFWVPSISLISTTSFIILFVWLKDKVTLKE